MTRRTVLLALAATLVVAGALVAGVRVATDHGHHGAAQPREPAHATSGISPARRAFMQCQVHHYTVGYQAQMGRLALRLRALRRRYRRLAPRSVSAHRVEHRTVRIGGALHRLEQDISSIGTYPSLPARVALRYLMRTEPFNGC